MWKKQGGRVILRQKNFFLPLPPLKILSQPPIPLFISFLLHYPFHCSSSVHLQQETRLHVK
nr:MAG TPA: hypothetical protein [Caudoviricetes sp.]